MPTFALILPPDGNRYPVPLFDFGHPWPNHFDNADTFMTGNEGEFGLDRPIAMGGVDVHVA